MEDSDRAKRKPSWISFAPYQLAVLKLLKEVLPLSKSKTLDFLRLLSEILDSLQLVSIILIFSVDLQDYEKFKGFISALHAFRPDYLALRYFSLDIFLLVGYSMLFFLVFLFSVLYLEILTKKPYIYPFLKNLFTFSLSFYMRFIKLPMLILLFFVLSRPDESKMISFYDIEDRGTRGYENKIHVWGIVLIALVSLVYKLKSLSSVLFTTKFGKRSDLKIDRLEEIAIFSILIMCVYLPRAHATYAITGIPAAWMIKCYYICLPSHSKRENFLKICRYLLVLDICASYYIALLCKEASFIFLSLLVIYPLLIVIAKVKMDSRMHRIENLEEFDEEGWEMSIRINTNLKQERNFQDFIKPICLKEKDNLKIRIMESKFYSEVLKDYSLSMVKLTKMIYFSKLTNSNILRQVEIVYETYCHFDYLLSKMDQKDQKLIQLGLEMNFINEKDIDTCIKLLKFLENLSHKKLYSGFKLLRISHEMKNKIKELRQDYKTLLKEFPGEIEFFKYYTSLKEILKKEYNVNVYKKAFGKKDLKTVTFKCGKASEIPQIIMNACPSKIGKIIYMNLIAKMNLKCKMKCKHLKNIMPSIQKRNVNEYLRETFFNSEKTEHEIPYVCFKRSDGYLLLVKVRIILAWHNFKSYFILSFIRYPRQMDYFIADQKNSVFEYGKSFHANAQSINELKFYCLSNTKDSEIAYFQHGHHYTGFIKCRLAFYHINVYLVMLFADKEIFEHIKYYLYNNQAQFFGNREHPLEHLIHILPSVFSKTADQSHSPAITYREIVEEKKKERTAQSNPNLQEREECLQVAKRAISLYTQSIRIGMKIVFFIYFITSLTVICLTEFGINEIENNIAIEDLGEMRAFTQHIVTTTRSLLLLKEGYEMEFSEDIYRSIMQSAVQNLTGFLLRFQDEVTIDILLKERLFTKNTVHVYDKLHKEIDESTVYLSEGLRKLIDKAVVLESNSLQNMTDYYYILRNGPTDILTVLNSTVYEALQITLDRIDSVQNIYIVLCALIFIPSVITIIVATPSIRYFETINKSFTKSFSKMNKSSISQLGGLIQERLIQEFDEEVAVDYGSKPCTNTMSMWTLWSYTIGLVSVATIASYFLITQVYPTQIFSMMKQRPTHDFWYGYSRMIPARNFYWSREAYLDYEGTFSYAEIFKDNSPISDMPGKTLEVAEEYSFLIKNIRFLLEDSYTHTLKDYRSMLYGQACTLLNDSIPHCERSLISRGIYSGILDFIFSVKSVSHMSRVGESDWLTIRRLENNSGILSNSCFHLAEIVTNSSREILDDLIFIQIILSSAVFVVLGIFMYAVMKIGLLNVADQMLSKIKIISIIDDNTLLMLAQGLSKNNRS